MKIIPHKTCRNCKNVILDNYGDDILCPLKKEYKPPRYIIGITNFPFSYNGILFLKSEIEIDNELIKQCPYYLELLILEDERKPKSILKDMYNYIMSVFGN